MKAAIYMGKENVEIQDLPKPICGRKGLSISSFSKK